MMSLRTPLILLAVAALGLAGCAGNLRTLPPADELDSQAVELSSQYVIGPTDTLKVSVWRQAELSVDSLVVRLDGKISLPLLDDVQAAGLTPMELKQVVTERLSDYVADPTVTVVVRQSNSKMVFVIGEVARQGPIMVRTDFRIVDAISSAGGFAPFAGKKNVKVIRSANGGDPVEFRFNFEKYVAGQDLEQNILLLPGDRIVVPEESPFWW